MASKKKAPQKAAKKKPGKKAPGKSHQPKTDNKRILKSQLPVQKVVEGIHENRRQLDERAFYPAHDKRKESSKYAAVHKNLCITLDLPCLVCGVRHSTLGNAAKNPYKAKAMETHHHIIEWALANAVDVDQFNNALLPNLNHRFPDEPLYKKPMNQQEIKDWVDNSEHNLWVLCDVHHRAPYVGVHYITYPIWCPQDLLRPDFVAYVNKQLGLGKKTASKKKPATKKK
jgi:hypothetical protein